MLHSILLVTLAVNVPDEAQNNPLWHMINQDYDERALNLIRANPELINRSRIRYGPPLLIAVQKKNFKLVKALVEAGADVNFLYYRKRPTSGISALSVAADSWQYDVAEYLLKAGADPNNCGMIETFYDPEKFNIDVIRRFSKTPLDTAASRGDLKMLKLLLKHGGDPKFRYEDKGSALHWATIGIPRGPDGKPNPKGRRDVLRHLVNLGCDPNEMRNGYSLLSNTAGHGWHEVVQMLLEDFDANIEAEDDPGKLALFRACSGHPSARKGHDDDMAATVKILLEHGANPFLRTPDGRTPYSVVLRPEVKKVLEDHFRKLGVDPASL